MMNPRFLVSIAVFFQTVAIAQLASTAISHKDACGRFSNAVVQIEPHAASYATAFIVSPDGFILTAAHAVIGIRNETVDVVMPDGSKDAARLIVPLTPELIVKDFAILKLVKPYRDLPYLKLGNELVGMPVGSDITIIGFPASALAFNAVATGQHQRAKFCLTGTVASLDMPSFLVPGQAQPITVSVIYFQGVSVKGLSGSPIISRDSGQVVGILTESLAGISASLQSEKSQLVNGPAPGIQITTTFAGVPWEKTMFGIIDALDTHLANGLGAATGITDAAIALNRAKRHQRR